MNIRDFRKNIFVNSQYCTYYLDQNNTVAAGILRSNGYKFQNKFSEEQILKLEKMYRNYTTLLNCAVGIEIVLYIYCVLFPFFVQFLQLPYFIAVLIFAVPPLVALFLTYVVFDGIYQNKLKEFGEYEKVKFKANVYNVEPSAFDRYMTTSRKSGYILLIAMLIFIYYAFTPIFIDILNTKGKYEQVIKSANLYLKFVPINSDVHAQRAYAKYKLDKFDEAVKDYKAANLYSNSDTFDYDILGAKIKTISFEDAVKEFDNALAKAEDKASKYYIQGEKAIFLQQNKKYNEALKIYDMLINAYKNNESEGFAVDNVYYNRSLIRTAIGDASGAASDLAASKSMCSDCNFDLELHLVRQP